MILILLPFADGVLKVLESGGLSVTSSFSNLLGWRTGHCAQKHITKAHDAHTSSTDYGLQWRETEMNVYMCDTRLWTSIDGLVSRDGVWSLNAEPTIWRPTGNQITADARQLVPNSTTSEREQTRWQSIRELDAAIWQLYHIRKTPRKQTTNKMTSSRLSCSAKSSDNLLEIRILERAKNIIRQRPGNECQYNVSDGGVKAVRTMVAS